MLLVATVEIFLRLLDLSENQNCASRNPVSALCGGLALGHVIYHVSTMSPADGRKKQKKKPRKGTITAKKKGILPDIILHYLTPNAQCLSNLNV